MTATFTGYVKIDMGSAETVVSPTPTTYSITGIGLTDQGLSGIPPRNEYSYSEPYTLPTPFISSTTGDQIIGPITLTINTGVTDETTLSQYYLSIIGGAGTVDGATVTGLTVSIKVSWLVNTHSTTSTFFT
jgi:hypothetical protein